VKVCYPLHPLRGNTLPVVQEFLHGGEAQFLVQGSDRCQVVPAWMGDPLYCGHLTIGWHPLCDWTTLLKLQQLLRTIDYSP